MGSYDERRGRADAYLPAELAILSTHFNVATDTIAVADDAQDRQEATDLVLPDGTRIAKRVRSAQMVRHYGEILFRNPPNSSYPTEWEKILTGCADYCLYSFALNDTELVHWWLIDLETIRLADETDYKCCRIPDEVTNGDEGFVVVRLDGFPSFPPLVAATSEPMPKSTDDACEKCRRFSFERAFAVATAAPGAARRCRSICHCGL